MIFKFPVIIWPAGSLQNFEFLQSHDSGVLVSISRLATNLLKLNIVLLIGYYIITNNR